MTDQRQSTRDQWAPPAPTLEQADPDWTGPASSSQNSAAKDWTDVERPAVEGTVYESAAHESAIDGSVPVGRADLDDADPEHADPELADPELADPELADPELAVGVASVPEAVAATDTDADTVDRSDIDSEVGAAQDAARIDGPNGAYGIKGHPADTPAAVEEREPTEEHGSLAVATDTGQPLDGVDERIELADGEVPLVPVPGDDAVASDVTGSGELLPGDVPDEPGLALLDGDTAGRFRDRWHELQLRFVDDPHTAADQAGALVDEVVAALRDAVDGQRSALEEWQSGDGIDTHSGDTERLRVAVRRYRDFLDRLLGL